MTRSSRTAVPVRATRRNTTCDRKAGQRRTRRGSQANRRRPGDELYDYDFEEVDCTEPSAEDHSPTANVVVVAEWSESGFTPVHSRVVSNYETFHRLPPQQPTRFRSFRNTRDCAMACFPMASIGAHNVQTVMEDDNYLRQAHSARRGNNVCSSCWPCLAGRFQRQTHEATGSPVPGADRASAAAAFWAACFEHSPSTTKRALSNYEAFHGLPAGKATVDQLAMSCAGFHGWASWWRRRHDLQLAFAMGTHARLGAGAGGAEGHMGCPYFMMPADLVEHILGLARDQQAGDHDGVSAQNKQIAAIMRDQQLTAIEKQIRTQAIRDSLAFLAVSRVE